MEQEKEPLKELFKKEFAKMVAVISKRFGLQHIEIAEDIVSETFLSATENWQIKGLPKNPTAWLYLVAKQKALRYLTRNKVFDEKIVPELSSAQEDACGVDEIDFSRRNISDSQLQMMLAVCNPAIASEAQIGLALRILCGFSIDEIAEAFLSNKETINKRLFRAKEKLRAEKVKMEMPAENEVENRLNNVLQIVYLLFNEGYYSKTENQLFRKELCLEALRLGIMLVAHKETAMPKTYALLALMCFHASRFSARQINHGSSVLYGEQDPELWDAALIKEGIRFFGLSAQGEEVTSYHLEARIAYWHCVKEDSREKWEDILHLYNQLLLINYSPAVALNRTFALYKADGYEAALIETEKLKLINNHFYFILLGELYKHTDIAKAKQNFENAYVLAKTSIEKQIIQQHIDSLL